MFFVCCLENLVYKATEENGRVREAETSKGSYERALSIDTFHVAGMG
jgi:hypothetical protein